MISEEPQNCFKMYTFHWASRCLLWVLVLSQVGCSGGAPKLPTWMSFRKSSAHEVTASPTVPAAHSARATEPKKENPRALSAPVTSAASIPANSGADSSVDSTSLASVTFTSNVDDKTPVDHTPVPSNTTYPTIPTGKNQPPQNAVPVPATKPSRAAITSLAGAVLPSAESVPVSPIRRELNGFHSFPFKLNVADLDGRPLQLSDMRGRVVVVDVWGTWCGPCRKAIPHLVKLQSKHSRNLQVIGLANEKLKDVAAATKNVKQAIANFGINYPCALIDDQFANSLPDFRGYPTVLFIDKTGRVRLQTVGLKPVSYWDAVVAELIAEPDPESMPEDPTDRPFGRVAGIPGQ
jgi:thiol-disulfide isomerase/thioredoxin